MQPFILLGILASTYIMVIAKRMPALVRGFRLQSFFLFLITLAIALKERQIDLYVVAALVLALKVILIPYFLYRMIKRTKANQDLGLFINAQLSLVFALGFMYLSWVFTEQLTAFGDKMQTITLAMAFFVVLVGIFLMIFRMTALAQITGLLVMENGLFLLASTISGGMPFFVEIAIFFDVFVSVVIMGLFVYRINKLFTHIDVNKLSRLKG
ncbi:MAG: hydrogenase [Candidatus Omnitrophica bacterium]|nr:hydrogenase [Candidatus Omnitrophota bacterium]